MSTKNKLAGEVRMPGFAVGDRDSQSRIRYGPPALGEHSCEVLVDLGLTTKEIDTLLKSGAVIQLKD